MKKKTTKKVTKIIKKKSVTKPKKLRKTKKVKFLGVCNTRDCKTMIGGLDLISPLIFVCPACDRKDKINKLKPFKSTKDKPTTKRDYLNQVIESKIEDLAPMTPLILSLQPNETDSTIDADTDTED